MGAQIDGVGTATITIEGVDRLHPTTHRTVGDRVVGGTWAYAAAITRGSVRVEGVDPVFMTAPLERLARAGAEIESEPDAVTVTMAGAAARRRLHHHAVPGFPDRSAADGAGARRGGRRPLADHRERLRGAVPVRRRADPDGCRRPDRRASRLDARARAAVQRAGLVDRHPGRRRPGARRAGRRGRHRGARGDRTSTAATRTSSRTCRSSAATIERVVDEVPAGSEARAGCAAATVGGADRSAARAAARWLGRRRVAARVAGCVSWWPGVRWTTSVG